MNLLTSRPRERGSANGGATALSKMRNEVERVFDRYLAEPFEVAWYGRTGNEWMPKLDMMEDNDNIMVRMEIPGVTSKNVDVSIRDNVLTISGHKESSSHEEGKDFYMSEREFGSFKRMIELPPGCDAEKITASQDNGVLTVKIARTKAATPKRIPVKSET